MSLLFFRLNGVPTDEADDVRELLANNQIEFYETSAGNWGVSMPAIWLYHPEDMLQAQPLLDDYQRQRVILQRNRYLQAKLDGEHNGFWQQTLSKPLHFLSYFVALGLVVYASVKWLFDLGL
jgi:hypothetical protein